MYRWGFAETPTYFFPRFLKKAGARSSVVERRFDVAKVSGSIPLGPNSPCVGWIMGIVFKPISKKYFQEIHDLALQAWNFSYKHIPKIKLKKLVDRYYSLGSLEQALSESKGEKQFFVLALENNRVAGFCHVAKKGPAGELCRLYIKPSLIGKGLGKKLLQRGEKFLKKRGAKKYFTFVNRHNKIGTGFYLRNGFKRNPKKDKDDEFEQKALWYIEKQLLII